MAVSNIIPSGKHPSQELLYHPTENSAKTLSLKGTRRLSFYRIAEDGTKKRLEVMVMFPARHKSKASFANIVSIERDSIELPTIYFNVGEDFLLNLQEKHGWIADRYPSSYFSPYYRVQLFSPLTRVFKVDLCENLGVTRPSWNGYSESFTFAFLKAVFKALGMRGYSSKSKEQLLDEILERITRDAQEFTPPPDSIASRTCLCRDVDQHSNAIAVTDYHEAVAILSRAVGNNIYLPRKEPTPDARIFARPLYLFEACDPYEGLEDFLAEQSPDTKEKEPPKEPK